MKEPRSARHGQPREERPAGYLNPSLAEPGPPWKTQVAAIRTPRPDLLVSRQRIVVTQRHPTRLWQARQWGQPSPSRVPQLMGT